MFNTPIPSGEVRLRSAALPRLTNGGLTLVSPRVLLQDLARRVRNVPGEAYQSRQYGHVGHVEYEPGRHVYEVHDVAQNHPVHQIAGCAGEHQP